MIARSNVFNLDIDGAVQGVNAMPQDGGAKSWETHARKWTVSQYLSEPQSLLVLKSRATACLSDSTWWVLTWLFQKFFIAVKEKRTFMTE